MKKNESRAFRLFSLANQVSQLRNKKQAVKELIGGLTQIWENGSFSYHSRSPKDQNNSLEISIHQENFGYLRIEGFDELSQEDRSLLHSFVTLFASILKNIHQDTLLSNEEEHLRKLVEERTKALSEKEERSRWIMNHAKDMIYRMSIPDGRYEYVSPASKEIMGYTPEEFYLKPLLIKKILHPAWRDFFKKEWQAVISGNISSTYEYQIIHQSGEIRWMSQQNVLIKDKQGNPVAIEGIVRDITENKRTQEEIRKAKEQLEEAQQLAKIGHWEWDMKTNISQWSDQSYRNFGLEPQSVPVDYELFRSFIVKEDRAFEEAESIKLMNLEIPFYNIDLRIRRADGKPAVINTYGKIYFNDQGQPVRMAGTIQDITERIKAEELAKENETRFSAIFNANEDSQLLVQIGPDKVCEIVAVNEALIRKTRSLGYDVSREDCLGIDMMKIPVFGYSVEPVNLELILNNYQKIVKSKKRLSYEDVLEIGGEKVYSQVTMTPIFGNDHQVRYILHTSHNITDLKTAEIELRQNQQFIESIVNLSPDILYIFDRIEKKNIYINSGIQTVLGYTVEEIQNMGSNLLPILMHPDDLQIYLSDVYPRYVKAKDGDFIEHQYRMKHKSGDWHFLECKEIVYLRLPDGSPKQIFGVIHDITHRKEAEAALRESEEKYRQLFNTMLDGYALHEIICNSKGKPIDYRFLDINPAFEALTGLKKENLIGHTVLEVLPNIESVWIEKYGKVALTGETLSFSNYSGELGKYYSVNAFSPQKNQFAVVFVDVTEQKRAEEALRTSERQLSIASKIARVGYWEFDVDQKMFTFNDHFYDIFRTNANEIGGYQIPLQEYAGRFLHPDDRYVVAEETRKALEATDPNYHCSLTHRIIFPNGDIGYISVYIFIVKNAEGRTVKTYGTNQDITDRIKLENQIKKELKEKEILLREIHHRVKNNLNVITSLLGLQEAKIKNKKQALEAFEESRNRVYSMAMVHELLYKSEDFSKVDMKPYIEQMTHQLMFANMLKEKINLSIDVEEAYLGINTAIPCGLILNEMISNALKHAFLGKEKGRIKITFNRLKDKTYKLVVRDNGMGLPDNFDLKTSKTMGFQLMRILSQQLEGELVVKPGKGTRLILKFPEES